MLLENGPEDFFDGPCSIQKRGIFQTVAIPEGNLPVSCSDPV